MQNIKRILLNFLTVLAALKRFWKRLNIKQSTPNIFNDNLYYAKDSTLHCYHNIRHRSQKKKRILS